MNVPNDSPKAKKRKTKEETNEKLNYYRIILISKQQHTTTIQSEKSPERNSQRDQSRSD